jgi:hypothetical protein
MYRMLIVQAEREQEMACGGRLLAYKTQVPMR